MENKSKTSSLHFGCLLVLFLLAFASLGSRASNTEADKEGMKEKQKTRRKLFVFGDSYGDTGNWKKGTGVSWEDPYGSTFPGKPAGRFSDGRILTDFIASYLGIRSPPVPYTQRRSPSAAKKQKFGMNFAYGGTGVFDTGISQPNMTIQIDLFHSVLQSESAYTIHDLQTSIALIALGGNDYANLLRSAPSHQDTQSFTKSVVDQLLSNLKRIHKLGIPKIAVTGLEPLGCLPVVTSSSSYQNCSDRINAVATLHNSLLEQSVAELNNQTGGDSFTAFFVLDLYSAFMSGLKTPHLLKGKMESESGLEPCCQGVRGGFGCGSRDGNRTQYRVCGEAGGAFFWDSVHPAQHGWHLVFLSLTSSLRLLK